MKEETLSSSVTKVCNMIKRYDERATVRHQTAMTNLYEEASHLNYEQAKIGKQLLDNFFNEKN